MVFQKLCLSSQPHVCFLQHKCSSVWNLVVLVRTNAVCIRPVEQSSQRSKDFTASKIGKNVPRLFRRGAGSRKKTLPLAGRGKRNSICSLIGGAMLVLLFGWCSILHGFSMRVHSFVESTIIFSTVTAIVSPMVGRPFAKNIWICFKDGYGGGGSFPNIIKGLPSVDNSRKRQSIHLNDFVTVFSNIYGDDVYVP